MHEHIKTYMHEHIKTYISTLSTCMHATGVPVSDQDGNSVISSVVCTHEAVVMAC